VTDRQTDMFIACAVLHYVVLPRMLPKLKRKLMRFETILNEILGLKFNQKQKMLSFTL